MAAPPAARAGPAYVWACVALPGLVMEVDYATV